MSTPDKNPYLCLWNGFAVLAVLVLVSCAAPSAQKPSGSKKTAESSDVRESTRFGLDDLDFGQDWDADDEQNALTGGPTSGRASAVRRVSGYWTLILGTFSTGDHRTAANTMVSNLGQIDRRLEEAHVNTTRDGSSVVYGVYEDVDSPDAQRDLEWVQNLKFGGRKVFPRALLSRIDPDEGTRKYRSHELMSVREQYPTIDPLYTLQIAVWGKFDGSGLAMREVRERAEAYALELRGQSVPAYVHHDDGKRVSMVTVGLFDETAIDAQSGLLDPRVEALKRKYPAHLVNGEPLNEPIDKRRPSLGTRVQAPRLVKVPAKK